LPLSHQYIIHILSKSRPYFSDLNLGKSENPDTPHLKVDQI